MKLTKSDRSLGDLCRSCPIEDRYSTFTLERFYGDGRLSRRRSAYYIGQDSDNNRLFGVDGMSHMLSLTSEQYGRIGSPEEGKTIPIKKILRLCNSG
jgi:hypothetical protein